jgi:hypothetical protein
MRKRKSEEWVCHEFPNCPCGRASQYSTKPLYRYSADAEDRWAIADSFVILRCIADHAPDAMVRFTALFQLVSPKYDRYQGPDDWPWL